MKRISNLGLGNKAKTSELFREALKYHSNNLWAKYYASQN
jgi:hypothetical protein